MTIYLLRHGMYDPTTGHLSPQGIEDLKALKTLLDSEGITFDLVLTSPKKRARETAEILRGNAELKEMIQLAPSSTPQMALSMIPRDRDVLIVSHNPLLMEMAANLGGSILFEPGTLAIFDDKGLHKVITP